MTPRTLEPSAAVEQGVRVSESAALAVIAAGAAASGAMAFLGAPIPPPVVPTIAHLSGMWAGYGVAVMLLLMARIPALERGVGADRLARWHAKGGRAIVLLVLLHGLTATIGWMQAQDIDPITATAQVLGMPGLLAATAATAIFCAIGIISARSARKRLSYEAWHALHLTTPYGAVTEHRRSGRGVLLLAGGVGITPMRALFQTIDVDHGPVTLLYRASSDHDLLFVQELRELAIERRMELRFIVGRSSDPTKALSRANLRKWIPDVAHRDVFMCASPRFAAAARTALLESGVPVRRIHHEEFAF